jgi:hypothetical protein
MPTIYREGAYRFFFYSNENDEPPHVHVEGNDCVAKFWLEDARLAKNHGFAGPRLTRIQSIVKQHQEMMMRAWHDHFSA